jgi:poly(hydroxyalkanoate) granule-associated protein
MATKKKASSGPLRESAEKVWLAGLGAVAAAEEEGERIFKTLVGKGEKYRRDVRKPVDEATQKVRGTVDDVRGRAGKTWERIENAFDDQVTSALRRLGVPSRREISDLTRRVETITR